MASNDRFVVLEETRLNMEESYLATSMSKIQKVQSYMREREKYEKYYSPKLISFGPIHHGDPKLKRGEKLKLMWASMYVEANQQTPQVLHKRIADNIAELRGLYSWHEIGLADDHYSDEDLGWMLFVDGCSVLQILEKANLSKPEDLRVKVDVLVKVERDLFLLENQLPYQLLKLLSKDEVKLKISMHGFCELQNMFTALEYYDSPLFKDPQHHIETIKKSSPPTHLLDCLRTSILSTGTDQSTEEDQPELQTERGEQSSQPTHLLDGLRTFISGEHVRQTFTHGFRKLQNVFTLRKPEHEAKDAFTIRKLEHEIERGKTSSSPILEHDIERGNYNLPSPKSESETEGAGDPFNISRVTDRPPKRLRRWRQAASVLNASRRFRYTLDLKKEEERQRILRQISAHARAIRAAYLFKAENLLDVVHAYANRNKKEKYTSYRNIQELKAAAIVVKRQKNISLKNISFSSSFLGGKLHLPPLILNDSTVPTLLNLAAYELCPDFINKFEISSYIKLLDLLIDYPEDVKELRSSGILHNSLGCDEEVVELFNTISSGLMCNPALYFGLRDEVEKHYKNKLSIWMAEAYYTYFKSPWTIIGVLAALLALVLTALQTFQGFKSNST
ncbi:hypothetical protein L6164_007774 [Bauhinia variegata]|uniref:Uncharacterized protein n=1 Tax=Bauhinia variegata TaxID=167791 RepID=A0ACB9PES2_BAUVA|nr:hypothetical protein L6164_007774 [Bauhinia variegata]